MMEKTVNQPANSFLQICDFITDDSRMVTWQLAEGGVKTVTYQGEDALREIAAIMKAQTSARHLPE